ncbi:MAG: ATP-binding protein [Treponema sp.]|jgi:predicted AAA+ superfamily ATPase|nr:ATP-binding protein [Treponema sp.]
MYQRDIYLDQLIKLRGTAPIKVITGVRRCGKSTLLDLFEEYLLGDGVPRDAIIRMNFELVEFDHIRDYRDLLSYLEPRTGKYGKTWLLLDEIQQVSGWEKGVNSLQALKQADIYLTGSNAYMLSSELATLLAGRYIEIKMLPLSFKEYLDFNRHETRENLEGYFNAYIEYGGFPGLSEIPRDDALVRAFLSGIYNTILLKDVVSRNTIRDVDLLEKVVRFITSNIGNMVSAQKISDYLISSGRKTSHETIDSYLKMLENANMLYKVRRYDIKGKEFLKNHGKYYIVDMGLRYWSLGKKNADMGSILENILYLELLRRGYQVFIGKLPASSRRDLGDSGALEVDFITLKAGIKTYYQVTWTMQSPGVQERELKPLQAIDDNYEKIILSMDRTPFTDYEGIKHLNIIDFLLTND